MTESRPALDGSTMLLDSPHLQKLYAVEAYDIYLRWQKLSELDRKAKIEATLRQVAKTSSLPMPKIVWGTGGNSFFRHASWEIHASERAVTTDPGKDLKQWLHVISSPYHELRHADQHRMIIKAYLTRALPVPDTQTRRNRAYFFHAEIADIMEAVMTIYDNFTVLSTLDDTKSEFRQEWIPQVRAWSDSQFGSGANKRNQTFRVMHKLQDQITGEHFAAYRALPEEMDAFRVQSEVKASIKAIIARHTDYSGLADLFS